MTSNRLQNISRTSILGTGRRATLWHFVPCLASLTHITRDKRFAYAHPNSSFRGTLFIPKPLSEIVDEGKRTYNLILYSDL